MNLPRELSLSQTPEGIRLIQKPVKEVESLRTESWSWQNEVINEGSNILQGIRAEAFELFLEVTVNQDTSNFGLVLRRSTKARTTFGYNPKTKQLFFDRSQSGLTDFGDTYPQSHQAPLEANENGRITIRTVVDRASIEIFANDGLVIMSEQFFAPEDALGLEFFVEGKNIKVHELSLWKLAH